MKERIHGTCMMGEMSQVIGRRKLDCKCCEGCKLGLTCHVLRIPVKSNYFWRLGCAALSVVTRCVIVDCVGC